MDADPFLSMTERHSIWAFAALYFSEQAAQVCRDIGSILTAMQEQFGPRDPDAPISRIEFADCHPFITFPNCPNKHAVISLSNITLIKAQRGDINSLYWQLAHECVHLLSPRGTMPMTVLEEGIACWFQYEFMKSRYEYDCASRLESYWHAFCLLRPLLAENPDLIRSIRREEPILACITASLIRRHCPSCSEKAAAALTQRFDRDWKPPASAWSVPEKRQVPYRVRPGKCAGKSLSADDLDHWAACSTRLSWSWRRSSDPEKR